MFDQDSVNLEILILFIFGVNIERWFLILEKLLQSLGIDIAVGFIFKELLVVVEPPNFCIYFRCIALILKVPFHNGFRTCSFLKKTVDLMDNVRDDISLDILVDFLGLFLLLLIWVVFLLIHSLFTFFHLLNLFWNIFLFYLNLRLF